MEKVPHFSLDKILLRYWGALISVEATGKAIGIKGKDKIKE